MMPGHMKGMPLSGPADLADLSPGRRQLAAALCDGAWPPPLTHPNDTLASPPIVIGIVPVDGRVFGPGVRVRGARSC